MTSRGDGSELDVTELGADSRGTMHSVCVGTGRPLLLVHGLGSHAGTWRPIMEALSDERRVIALDLPGFGRTPPLGGEITIATLTDAVQHFIEEERLGAVDMVGSSMGARIVLELARRGIGGDVVALDPGGFWTDGQRRLFGLSIGASIRLIRIIRPLLPVLVRNPIARTVLLAQFSVRPWNLPADLVLEELQNFTESPSFDDALRALADGPVQLGMQAGTVRSRITIGWGDHDRVTWPSESSVALERFPDAQMWWISHSGHFPHWDQPVRTAALILQQTGQSVSARTTTTEPRFVPIAE